MTVHRAPPSPLNAALGALIAARRGELGVHVVECAPGQFDVVLRVGGPWPHYEGALRAARWLAEAIDGMLPGPPNTIGARNPRPLLIRPVPAPARRPT
ncbi:hypothetical protein [Mycobacterium sp. 29Ha]|uniref:hypothetical protein n=1 Tax=Mycobacterium sp. 29Ha TaxID=2939268 RepID=UPI00293937CB|nr:hypothetical protein [Mycobacterium sp. 29Ha]MDV3136753.1 hypothetical protein [Mycobacterium sp. 29Ha]